MGSFCHMCRCSACGWNFTLAYFQGAARLSPAVRSTNVLFALEVQVQYHGRAMDSLRQLFRDEGQDIAEYAVMLAVIIVIVVGTIKMIGSNADSVFSQIGSAIK